MYLFLGVGHHANLKRECRTAEIQTYSVSKNGRSCQLLYRTGCEQIPSAFSEVRGRLVTGVGNILRVYEIGQKKLLKKYENKSLKSPILQIQCNANRIFVGDVAESVHVFKFKPEQGQLYVFADDLLNRFLTSFCILDDDTVAGVDKFENFFVNRLPAGCEEDAEDDPSTTKHQWENGFLNGAKFKYNKVCQFYLGEMGTSLKKAQISQSSQEMMIFGTTMGSICCMIPIETR